MEETINKTKFRIQSCTNRRLSIQHEFDEHLRKQNHLSNLHFYKYQEELFNRKMNHLRKNLEHIEPYVTDDINDEEALMTPNCFTRIQNHFRLLNFSSDTEKRLLCQAPSYNKSNKQISNQLPNISQKRNANEINQCIRRVSFYQSRPPKTYSCRSASNHHFRKSDFLEKKNFQSYLNQQIFDEQKKQINNVQRKTFLLKEFDELKHTIDDPNATLSVLAALSRAIYFLDSATE
jgi:hypothetical protein